MHFQKGWKIKNDYLEGKADSVLKKNRNSKKELRSGLKNMVPTFPDLAQVFFQKHKYLDI